MKCLSVPTQSQTAPAKAAQPCAGSQVPLVCATVPEASLLAVTSQIWKCDQPLSTSPELLPPHSDTGQKSSASGLPVPVAAGGSSPTKAGALAQNWPVWS